MKMEMKDGTQAQNNGNFGEVSRSKFSELLATRDRDFLLSPTGAQVLSVSLTILSQHPLGNSLKQQ